VVTDPDDARVAEIERLFIEKGWRLRLEPNDYGEWTAAFWLALPHHGQGTVAHDASGRTRVDAAEAAWSRYQREPSLGGNAAS
jgi:hypothetical protein